jgi:hypothetical protein
VILVLVHDSQLFHRCMRAGSGRTQVAKVIGSMLSSHDNTRTRASKLVMPSRQEVFHPHSMSRTQELLEKVRASVCRVALGQLYRFSRPLAVPSARSDTTLLTQMDRESAFV